VLIVFSEVRIACLLDIAFLLFVIGEEHKLTGTAIGYLAELTVNESNIKMFD
jgi:hypothetical protein